MMVARQFCRIAVVGLTLAASSAPAAMARLADMPVTPAITGNVRAPDVAAARSSAPVRVTPRVDQIGAYQAYRSAPPAAPAVRLSQASSTSGFDWPSAAIGAAALMSIALLALAGRSALEASRRHT